MIYTDKKFLLWSYRLYRLNKIDFYAPTWRKSK